MGRCYASKDASHAISVRSVVAAFILAVAFAIPMVLTQSAHAAATTSFSDTFKISGDPTSGSSTITAYSSALDGSNELGTFNLSSAASNSSGSITSFTYTAGNGLCSGSSIVVPVAGLTNGNATYYTGTGCAGNQALQADNTGITISNPPDAASSAGNTSNGTVFRFAGSNSNTIDASQGASFGPTTASLMAVRSYIKPAPQSVAKNPAPASATYLASADHVQ